MVNSVQKIPFLLTEGAAGLWMSSQAPPRTATTPTNPTPRALLILPLTSCAAVDSLLTPSQTRGSLRVICSLGEGEQMDKQAFKIPLMFILLKFGG